MTDVRLADCRAASEVAARWIDAGSFRSVARLDALCVAPGDLATCVSAQDGASRACQCVRDPFADGCGVDPKAVCRTALSAAIAQAQTAVSLVPLDAFAAESTSTRLEAERGRLAEAREAVCRAGQVAPGPAPGGLARCEWVGEAPRPPPPKPRATAPSRPPAKAHPPSSRASSPNQPTAPSTPPPSPSRASASPPRLGR